MMSGRFFTNPKTRMSHGLSNKAVEHPKFGPSLFKAIAAFSVLRGMYVAWRHGYSADQMAQAAKATMKLTPKQFPDAIRGKIDVCTRCNNLVHRDNLYCPHCGGFLGGPEVFDQVNGRKH